ncbi:MAG: Fis family transcriptional regulator [Myxococcaceae bacterium]|nr:Fis family transcriptional regulator [Myxococcaceae bacterium]
MNAALPTVLVVDDRPNMLRLLQKVLRNDARVLVAGSGTEAIVTLRNESIAVVVCDLKMPDVDGIEVLRASKQLRPHAEFILMTAHASVATAVDAVRLGAYDYLLKPFEPEAVRTVVLRAQPFRCGAARGISYRGRGHRDAGGFGGPIPTHARARRTGS